MSSKRKIRRNQHDGKRKFPSHAAALAYIRELQIRGVYRGKTEIYACTFGERAGQKHYHFGHISIYHAAHRKDLA